MQAYLVGLKCYKHKFGCDCTNEITSKEKEDFEMRMWQEHTSTIKYDDNCYYTIVRAESMIDITLDICLQQQGATEYEHAVEIWGEYDIIEHLPHLSV